MALASAHRLSYIKETTPGTIPTNPRWQSLPDTRTTLNLLRGNLQSNRIQGSRFPAEPRPGASSVGGEIPTDLSAETYDDFLAAALRGTWSAPTGDDTVEINVDAGGAVAQSVGDTIATTNGTVTVERISPKEQETVLIYEATASPGVITTFEFFDNTAQDIDGASFVVDTYVDTVNESTVLAGEVRQAFSILREFSDFAAGTTKPFFVYRGCEVSQMTIQATADSLATCSFTMFGQNMDDPSATAPTNSSYKPPIDTQVFDTFSGSLELDGVEKCIVTDYSVTVNNGLQPRYTVGCKGSLSPEVGQSVVTGSLTLYLEDETIYEKYIKDQALALKLTLQDGLNNKRIINLPNLRLLPGTQPDVTEDGSITLAVSFSAHYDNNELTHISIKREDALAA